MSEMDPITLLWLLLCSALAFLMQAGFTLIETGSIRAKNSVNVAMKNLADFVVVSFVFVFWGFHLTGGESLFSFEHWPINPDSAPVLLFNIMFVTTAATIVSGCVAERMSFKGYVIVAFFVGALSYPVIAYYGWNPHSWFVLNHFTDFAGSTIVHVTGGIIGLIGTCIIGPRYLRFHQGKNALAFPSYNLTLVTLGVFFLLFAWMGFNGGSLYQFNSSISSILLYTLLAGATAGVVALLLVLNKKHIPITYVMNSILGGLVAVTASVHLVSIYDVLVLGALGAFTVLLGDKWLIKKEIDDPVGAVPVHLFCGVLGTIYAGFVASRTTGEPLFYMLLIQLLGVLLVLAWAGLTGFLIFTLLKRKGLHRVTENDEKVGLNISEHGVTMSWFEAVKTIEKISAQGDYTRRVPVEIGTEAGDVATSFNHLLDELEKNIEVLHDISQGNLREVEITPHSDKDVLANSLVTMVDSLRSILDEVEDQISSKTLQLESNQSSLMELIEKFKHTQTQLMETKKMAALSGMLVGMAHELNTPLGITVTAASLLHERSQVLKERFNDHTISVEDMAEFFSVSTQCLEMINDNLYRSSDLVSQFKAVDQEMSPEEPKVVVLNEILNDIYIHLNEKLTANGVEFTIDCDKEVLAHVPPLSLRCALEELVNNSVKHAFSGEPAGNKHITVSVVSLGELIQLTVEDNGRGINGEHIEQIFQPFFTTLRANGGVGLGLYMVYNICTKKFNGSISVESEPAAGARFIISMPAASAREATA
ncbi:ammonium transporter [Vibrio sp. SCSIO 43135]|uniref:ATP-binding protein n=1 Tax=Vibrio sp. SCSIO 43135 TaxID=2819096 RepID=UPI002074C3E0|nr:ATP-binding protein [Vibrio sp. SCSIO 43135]USD42772.1 ammonium transporter [Vibrio sp. SCSIO 43135]